MAVASDDPIGALRALEEDDELRFTVASESIDARVRRVYAGDHVLWIVVSTPDDRVFKIETRWANGWLEPLVDEYVGSDDRVPIGCLGEVSVNDVRVDGSPEEST